MTAEANLKKKLDELGLAMPAASEPKGVYRPIIVVGNMAYTAGHLPIDAEGKMVTGRVGDDLDLDAGYRAAQLAGLGILATLQKALGDLGRVRRLVKLLGLVNSTLDFTQHPAVINGASELLAEVFGPDAGVAARSAFGAGSLPLGAAVEIEAIFEVE
ncbi:MAG: RidA family protein [Pirellulales bacterium]|nr:RidA family protein [Pirellulales bacterium]